MFCVKCGTELIDGAKFCTNCGAAVIVKSVAVESESQVKEIQADTQPEIKTEIQTETESVVQSESQPESEPETTVEETTVGAYQSESQSEQTDSQPSQSAGDSIKQPIHINFVADTLIQAFSTKGFLAICVLLSVGVGAKLLSGGGLDVIGILFVIGLWLARSAASSGNIRGLSAPLSMFKGLNLTNIILNWIGFGFLIMFSIILCIYGVVLLNVPPLTNAEIHKIAEESFSNMEVVFPGTDMLIADAMEAIFEFMFAGGLFVFAAIFAVIAAIILLLNVSCYRYIYRCSKSVANSFKSGIANYEKINAASNWLMVLGILQAVGTLGSLTTFNIFRIVASGSIAACYIIASNLLKKTFDE